MQPDIQLCLAPYLTQYLDIGLVITWADTDTGIIGIIFLTISLRELHVCSISDAGKIND